MSFRLPALILWSHITEGPNSTLEPTADPPCRDGVAGDFGCRGLHRRWLSGWL